MFCLSTALLLCPFVDVDPHISTGFNGRWTFRVFFPRPFGPCSLLLTIHLSPRPHRFLHLLSSSFMPTRITAVKLIIDRHSFSYQPSTFYLLYRHLLNLFHPVLHILVFNHFYLFHRTFLLNSNNIVVFFPAHHFFILNISNLADFPPRPVVHSCI